MSSCEAPITRATVATLPLGALGERALPALRASQAPTARRGSWKLPPLCGAVATLPQKLRLITLPLLALLLLATAAGCTVAPKKTRSPSAAADAAAHLPPLAPPLPDEILTRPPASAQDDDSAAAPAASAALYDPARPHPLKSPARPLDIKLAHGTRSTHIDGALVYLLRNADYDRAAKKAVPSPPDAKFTINPLATAHAKPLIQGRPMRVFIDPGHGGADPGAASADGRHKESRIALEISKLLAKRLETAGFEVRLSRADNTRTQVLAERPLKANNWKADLFVSIHLNANPSSEANGIETYILTPSGELSTMDEKGKPGPHHGAESGNANDTRNMQLGFAIHRRLATSTKLHDRGLRRARFTVLCGAKMPAVLVECGFITSKRNLWFVTSKEGQEKIATGIFEGICDYALGNLDANRVAYPANKPLFNKPAAASAPAAISQPSPAAPAPSYAPAQPAAATPQIIRSASPNAQSAAPRYMAPTHADDPAEDASVTESRRAAARAAGLAD